MEETGAPLTVAPDACALEIRVPDETGQPKLVLSWSTTEDTALSLTPPSSLTATTSFFGLPDPAVTMTATYATDSAGEKGLELFIPTIPVERTDGQALQELFREDGQLNTSVLVVATWEDGLECRAETAVPFRQWRHIDEQQRDCGEACTEPDDLLLPTQLDLDEFSDDVAASMADLVTVHTYSRSGPDLDNYTLVQLPFTGTPLQFTRIGVDVFDVWDTERATAESTTLNCSVWHQGSELVLTQGYPNLGQSVGVLFGSGESVRSLTYTQTAEDSAEVVPWLHHNCFIDPYSRDGDTVTIYTMNWEEESDEGGVWDSSLVRFDFDMDTGEIIGDVHTVLSAAALTQAFFKYGNGLSLSPAGSDDARWVGISYANDNHSPEERKRSFFVALPMTADGPQEARFLFVNASKFTEGSLTSGWQDTFPELEIVALPDDPFSGDYPINFPHNMELFQVEAAVEIDGELWDHYRLIIGVLGGMLAEKDDSGEVLSAPTRVYMYDVFAPTEGDGATYAELFCGVEMLDDTESHFDFVLPRGAGEAANFQWVGAYTANPDGELYWLDLWETDADQRCKLRGTQTIPFVSTSTATPIWAAELDPTHLYGPEITDVQIRYDADVLAALLAP